MSVPKMLIPKMLIPEPRAPLNRRDISQRGRRPGTAQTFLLSCGILSSLLYAITNDLLAALRYRGYSPFSQVVSELTSIGAPTRTPLLAMGLVYDVLLAAFGVGVWRSARGNRALGVTGLLLVGYGAIGPLWLPFPMTARGEIGTTTGLTDIMHIVMGAVTVLLMFSAIGFGARAFGGRFRAYSLGTLATVLAFGASVFAYVPRIAAGEPTPWVGVLERINIAAWLMWVAVLAVILLRGASGSRTAGSA
jgi:hypothetical protein